MVITMCSRARNHLQECLAVPRITLSSHQRSFATEVSSNPSASTSRASPSIPNPSAYAVFDRNAKRMQKNRAVRKDIKHSRLTDYIRDEVAGNLVDRLLVSVLSNPVRTM